MRGHGTGWNPCQANFKIKVLNVYKPIQIDSKTIGNKFHCISEILLSRENDSFYSYLIKVTKK